MATLVSSLSQDVATARPSVTAIGGQAVVAQEQILLRDEFEGATLDSTARWTQTTASGGTVAQASASGCTLSSSTNTAGSAIIQSQIVIPYLAGSETSLKASARFGTDGIASNTREIALRVDGNNYVEFLLNGTSLVTSVVSGGASFASDVSINVVNPDDNTDIDFEIRVSRAPDRVHFIVNDQQVASYQQRGASTRLFQGMLAQAYFRTLNAGSSADNTLILNSAIVTRRWNAYPQVIRIKRLAASGLAFRGPCYYLNAYRTSGTTSLITVYDNTAGSGTIVDEVSSTTVTTWRQQWPVFCQNGIYVSYASGTDPYNIYYMA